MMLALALALAGQKAGEGFTPTGQALNPYGTSLPLAGRPVAMINGGGGDDRIFLKDEKQAIHFSARDGSVRAKVAIPGGTSMTGIATLRDTTTGADLLYVTNAGSGLIEIDTSDFKIRRTLTLPKPKVGGEAYGGGIFATQESIFVCGSRGNELIEINRASGRTVRRLSLPPAPYEIVEYGEDRFAVTCWGRRPGKRKANSSGTPVAVDDRGVSTGGTLAIVNAKTWKIEREIMVGAMPTAMAKLGQGRLAVVCANADTLETLLPNSMIRKTVLRANPDDAFGSAPNGLAYEQGSAGRETLYVSLGGANALAVVDVGGNAERPIGLIPTGWYPGPVATSSNGIHVANIKGQAGTRGVYEFRGTLQSFARPNVSNLGRLTREARKLASAPREVPVRRSVPAVPVPERTGDPSPIKHVVYIIRENRTYDQVLGDVAEGDGDPSLCIFGEKVTPNAHALARQYVLLDNYYCNGVNSADGHAWSIEGNASAYFERSFGGWTRSYPFGDDPLSTSSTGFLWDHILARGLTFRNHGEYDYAELANPKTSYLDQLKGRGRQYTQKIGVERLRRYSSAVPGWNMAIPDQVRADGFIQELRRAEAKGSFPNLSILYLPQDHTDGTAPGKPTPRATVADNDLALGRAVAALSKSKFWPKMAIFVIEDDPQAGFDHVDGHRSVCLVVSPYTRNRGKVSKFYNQTSVTRTMLRILGLPPRTRFEAASPLMRDLFVRGARTEAYRARIPAVPLAELNPPLSKLKASARNDAVLSAALPMEKPDQIEDDVLNRILWNNRRPGEPYPVKFAGAHGRGLQKRGLVIHRDMAR